MKRSVDGIEYELTLKRVKNINMRITADGSVRVSAPPFADVAFIDEFVASRRAFIEKALKKTSSKIVVQDTDVSNEAIYAKLYMIYREVYARFYRFGFRLPQLKIRRMKTQWGNCRKQQGIITLNSYLYTMPKELTELVCAHELSHMVEANHSSRFYAVFDSVMPDRRLREARLKGYRLPA